MTRHLAIAVALLLFCLLWLPAVAQSAGHRTANFTAQTAPPGLEREVAEAAEAARRQLAIDWLGQELPDWQTPCPITVKVGSQLGAGGATSYVFEGDRVFGWEMHIQGSRERVLDSVIPHEVLHTVFASHFRRPLPRWADEGACTTVEHRSEIAKQERLLIQFLKTGKGIPYGTLFSMTEYPPDVLPLYAQGHSIASFLIEQHGRAAFVAFLGDGLRDDDWPRAVRSHWGYDGIRALGDDWFDWVKADRPALRLTGQLEKATRFVAKTPVLTKRVADRPRRHTVRQVGVPYSCVDVMGNPVPCGGSAPPMSPCAAGNCPPGTRVDVVGPLGGGVQVGVGREAFGSSASTIGANRALVSVSVPATYQGRPATDSGTGVLIHHANKLVVLTAGHNFRDMVGQEVTVYCPFLDGRRLTGRVAHAEANLPDHAVVTLNGGPFPRLKSIARRVGTRLRRGVYVGLGLGGSVRRAMLRRMEGTFVRRVGTHQGRHTSFLISAANGPRQGDSGGPVLDASGDVVGVIVGNHEPGTYMATGPEPIRETLDRVCGYGAADQVAMGRNPTWRDNRAPPNTQQAAPYQGATQRELQLQAEIERLQRQQGGGDGSLIDRGRAVAREGAKQAFLFGIKELLTVLVSGGAGAGLVGFTWNRWEALKSKHLRGDRRSRPV